ncbi:MAG TPA: MiaB/RimO family radical SAM methylthiotransferase [Candidatus Binatia bacterium]|nr:MiaB/RimO family radical SAM methylthiotransferase [Candidatus Binatia bacterium]
MSGDSQKTFYLETFGCQMNVHDSEKVVGTLMQEGYRQVETVEQADLILYNTCSIRDKAEQKVFHRLADYKKLQAQGKKFGVLGCVAQQEGEKIFERAPHVSLVCGSASYNKLPGMLVQLEGKSGTSERSGSHVSQLQRDVGHPQSQGKPTEAAREIPCPAGENAGLRDDASFLIANAETRDSRLAARDSQLVRITGLDDRQTDKCFETEFTARTNPHRGYVTIIEGCDKFCAYCVVPFTRGKERSRTSASVLAEAQQMADLGYSEIQLLGQNVNSYRDPDGKRTFAELLAAVGEVPGIKRVRFTTSHPRDFGRDIVDAIDAVPTLCNHVHLPVQSGSTRMLDAMQRLYTREQYMERIAWMKTARREISITTDVIVGFPGETEADFAETLSLLDEVGYDAVFSFKYSPRPNTPSVSLEDAIPEEEKSRRLEVLMARQRDIQIASYKRYVGTQIEVMVEGRNEARGQWVGRTSHNKTLNFTASDKAVLSSGQYAQVLVTRSFPNSLVGELVEA